MKLPSFNPSPSKPVLRLQRTWLQFLRWCRRVRGRDFLLRVRMLDEWITLDIQSAKELRRAGSYGKEEALLRRMLAALRPHDTVYDIGANIGVISLILALHAPGRTCRFHCFEPEPRNCRQLTRNIALNGLDGRMLPHQLALGGAEGEIELFIRGQSGDGRHSTVSSKGSTASLRVPLMTATKFAHTHNSSPAVVKIDVEGAEGDVLAGMEELMTTAPPREIFLEIHSKGLMDKMPGGETIDDWLQARGYALLWEQKRGGETHCHYQHKSSGGSNSA